MGKGKGSGLWLCLQAEDFVAAQRSTVKVQNWLSAKLREREGSLGLELHGFHFGVMDQNSDSGVSQETGTKRSEYSGQLTLYWEEESPWGPEQMLPG